MEQNVGIRKQAEGGAGRGTGPEGGEIRAEVLALEEAFRWSGDRPSPAAAQLQEENPRWKRLGAELTVDKTMRQDVLAKKF